MKNLEKYFRECDKNRIIDHALRAAVTQEGVKFYIHPINASGDTLDFKVQGNVLTQLNVKKEVSEVEQLTIDNLEKCFYEASHQDKKYVGVKIQMEGFPKPEIIINENANFDSKFAYYKKAYNEDLTLKTFSGIKIVGFTYGDTFEGIENDLLG